MSEDLNEPNTPPQKTTEERLAEAEAFIQTLKQKNTDLETSLQAQRNMEELSETLMENLNRNAARSQNPVEAPVENGQDPGKPQDEANPADLAEQVRRILAEESTKTTRDTNIKTAKSQLKEVYGDQYMSNLESVAEAMGVGVNFLTEMAARSPKGLVDLVKMHRPVQDKPKTPAAPPRSSVSPAQSQANTARKNFAYYKEIQKTDLNRYMSRQVQAEMHREAMEQGSAFYE